MDEREEVADEKVGETLGYHDLVSVLRRVFVWNFRIFFEKCFGEHAEAMTTRVVVGIIYWIVSLLLCLLRRALRSAFNFINSSFCSSLRLESFCRMLSNRRFWKRKAIWLAPGVGSHKIQFYYLLYLLRRHWSRAAGGDSACRRIDCCGWWRGKFSWGRRFGAVCDYGGRGGLRFVGLVVLRSSLVVIMAVMVGREDFGDCVRMLRCSRGFWNASRAVLPPWRTVLLQIHATQVNVAGQIQHFIFACPLVLLLFIASQFALTDAIAVRQYFWWVYFIADDSPVTTHRWHLITRLSGLVSDRRWDMICGWTFWSCAIKLSKLKWKVIYELVIHFATVENDYLRLPMLPFVVT